MKKIMIILNLFVFMVCVGNILAEPRQVVSNSSTRKEKPTNQARCPATTIIGKATDCLRCHVEGNFEVKETDPDAVRSYPIFGMFVRDGYGYYVIKDIGDQLADNMLRFFDYLTRHNIDKAILEIQSPGGSLFDACRVIGIMTEWQKAKTGRIIETKVNGFAASAGFLIATSGTVGYRYASKVSLLMWHQLYTFSMFKISTPSSSADEAKILKYIQDTINNWIASRSKLTKKVLAEKIEKKEFWVNGTDAVKYGFMDHLLD